MPEEEEFLLLFQFPLWDTSRIQLIQALHLYFQFPLWDTKKISW